MKQGQLEKLNTLNLTKDITDVWKNFIVSEVDDYVVRLAVVQNDFHWHHHAKGDEMFYVVSGQFFIDLEDRTVELGPNEMFTVPKMTKHRTRSEQRSVVMCFESRENDIMGS